MIDLENFFRVLRIDEAVEATFCPGSLPQLMCRRQESVKGYARVRECRV